jgi:excisionase family DNA binding protein
MRVREQDANTSVLPGWHTVKDVAKILNVSAGAIYNRIYRGDYEVVRAGRTLLLSDETVMKLYATTRHYETSR